MKLLTATEMAEKWKISPQRVAEFCKTGRIEAVKKGTVWLIDEKTKKTKRFKI